MPKAEQYWHRKVSADSFRKEDGEWFSCEKNLERVTSSLILQGDCRDYGILECWDHYFESIQTIFTS